MNYELQNNCVMEAQQRGAFMLERRIGQYVFKGNKTSCQTDPPTSEDILRAFRLPPESNDDSQLGNLPVVTQVWMCNLSLHGTRRFQSFPTGFLF